MSLLEGRVYPGCISDGVWLPTSSYGPVIFRGIQITACMVKGGEYGQDGHRD